jgi:hypothetical protein
VRQPVNKSHADTDGLQQASVLSVLLEFWIVLYETIEKFHEGLISMIGSLRELLRINNGPSNDFLEGSMIAS